jgi:hypothetical protein
METEKIKKLNIELALAENTVLKIREEIERNKPKPIIELVNNFSDACKIKNVSEDSIYLQTETKDEIAYKKIKFTISVLNEGWVPKMDGLEYRYYPYFSISSGFVFLNASFADANANTASASRLCLKNRELAIHAGKILINEFKDFIM